MASNAKKPSGVIAVLSDLIFETKLRSTAKTLGLTLEIVKSATALNELCKTFTPTLVIVDMNASNRSGVAAITAARSQSARPHVIAYVAHVDDELADEARQGGAHEVMPRSQFNARLPQILQSHGGCAIAPDPSI